MGGLALAECFRSCGPVDISSVLPLVGGLPFFTANPGGGSDPRRYQCDVVLSDKFPPALRELVAALPLGGRTGRAMLRRLSPGQAIPPHVDDWMPAELDWRRFQLPIVTHPGVVMAWPHDGVELHLQAGVLYEVRYDRVHEVRNSAPIDRVHLQIDQVDATI